MQLIASTTVNQADSAISLTFLDIHTRRHLVLEFSTMTDTIFLTEAQAAERLSLAPNTLAKWRWRGQGPAFRKFGGAVRYALADLDAYAEAAR